MRKRYIDITEKMAVAGLAVGLFQYNLLGVVMGVICLAITVYATRRFEQ